MQERTIYIGNLAYTAVEEDLEIAFEAFGEIEDIKLMRDKETDRSRGFAFITFETEAAAIAARSIDGQEIAGRVIRVNDARQRQQKNKPHSNKLNKKQPAKAAHEHSANANGQKTHHHNHKPRSQHSKSKKPIHHSDANGNRAQPSQHHHHRPAKKRVKQHPFNR